MHEHICYSIRPSRTVDSPLSALPKPYLSDTYDPHWFFLVTFLSR
jgi:hypothetical protein